MTEAIYKVGDILEFKSSQYFPACMYNISGPFRALIIRVDDLGYEYINYRLLIFSKECNNFINRYMSALQKDIITSAKRIGHIDVSLLRYEEKEQEEPDYAMFFTAATLAQAADLRNELDKIKKENEKLKAENKALTDTLSKSEAKAHTRLNRITFLTHKVDELENTNKKQKAECDEANQEISRLRTVIGGLNEVINDLYTSTVEISNLFSSLTTVLQTDDILEGVNKLKKENERLSNENENLKVMNDELRSSEKIRKLEEKNGKLEQKISCADKLLAEAANRLYQGRAHLNISAHN